MGALIGVVIAGGTASVVGTASLAGVAVAGIAIAANNNNNNNNNRGGPQLSDVMETGIDHEKDKLDKKYRRKNKFWNVNFICERNK